MSWDLLVFDFPADAKTSEDLPTDFKPPVIEKRTTLIKKIKDIAPSANFSDPAWGVIDGNDWSIEVNIAEEEGFTSFAFHVHGGDTAVGVVAEILHYLGLRAFNPQTGEFFEAGPKAMESFRVWRAYRDRTLDNSR